MAEKGIKKRKSEHLRIVAEREVAHSGTTLLEQVHLLHDALPELDWDSLDTGCDFFGKRLDAPLMVTSMTGGSELAGRLNRDLASVCAKFGIAFAVGSQRIMLDHPETTADFAVREVVGDGVLLGNIGAVQLLELPAEQIAGLVEAIDADGLCVHLNPAQELVQVEGNRNFKGILEALDRLVDRLDGRVLVKETGAGLSPRTLEKLAPVGVPYIDVSGAGGTSWTRVESFREINESLQHTGKVFSDWGIPTAHGIIAARQIMGETVTVIASGGIENGLDVARALALGANMAGFARSVLLPYLKGGVDAAEKYVRDMIDELKTAMLLTGSQSISDLRIAPKVLGRDLKSWLADNGWEDERM